MKNTGTLLKEKRESSNLSISEVALATKISPKILAAIESGDTARLPAKTFLKGFLRSYANFLKMDVDEVLRTYQEESGGPPPERVHEAYQNQGEQSTASPPPRRRVAEENSSGMRTAAIVVIVLLIGLILGVRELIEKYQREKIVESAENLKLSPLVQPPVTEVPQVQLTNTSAAALESAPAPEAVSKVEEPKVATAKVEAATPAPAPAVAVVPVPDKKIEEKKVEEKKPEEKTAALKNIRSEIILEALDKVDVKFKVKGETRQISLAPTQVHTIHTDKPVVFDFSDGGAVNIILNGKERGVPGDLGKPKQVTIP